jgi:hypothetical protein
MNQTTVMGISAIAIVVLLGVWLYATPQTAMAPADMPTTTAPVAARVVSGTPAKPVTANTSGNTYKSLLTQKGNFQCDYSQVTSDGQSNNVVYISDGKLRAEFRSTIKGQGGSNLSVYDGRYLYTWREGTSVGTKSLITSLGQLPTAIPKDLTSGAIHGDGVNSVGWDCHTWLVDKKLLTPPAYVSFK